MEEIDLAYIGGIMDGDGTIGITKRRAIKNQSCLYYPYVSFCSLNKNVCEFLKDSFLGNVITVKQRTLKDGIKRKEIYYWRLEKNNKCQNFLSAIYPFLIIKKEQALHTLDYIKENPFIRGPHRLSDEVILKREASYFKSREINNRKTLNHVLVKRAKKFSENELIWAYIAGILDTDGSFSIKREKRKLQNSKSYTPQILLSMNDIRGMNLIVSNCPIGNVNLIKAKSCILKCTYRWSSYSINEIPFFLDKVIPYLKIKQQQAILLKEFCLNKNRTFYPHGGVPKEEQNSREIYYNKMIMLNKYGVYKPSLIDLEVQEQDDKGQASESCAG